MTSINCPILGREGEGGGGYGMRKTDVPCGDIIKFPVFTTTSSDYFSELPKILSYKQRTRAMHNNIVMSFYFVLGAVTTYDQNRCSPTT